MSSSYQYWYHVISGDVYAVEIENGEVVCSNGPLYSLDCAPGLEEDFATNGSSEDASWFNESPDNFRLWEPQR